MVTQEKKILPVFLRSWFTTSHVLTDKFFRIHKAAIIHYYLCYNQNQWANFAPQSMKHDVVFLYPIQIRHTRFRVLHKHCKIELRNIRKPHAKIIQQIITCPVFFSSNNSLVTYM